MTRTLTPLSLFPLIHPGDPLDQRIHHVLHFLAGASLILRRAVEGPHFLYALPV
jgi:hypothetical protein